MANNITINQLTVHGQAYLDYDTKRGCYYTTLANDDVENVYRIYWLVTDDQLNNVFNNDDVCDWSRPDAIELAE